MEVVRISDIYLISEAQMYCGPVNDTVKNPHYIP